MVTVSPIVSLAPGLLVDVAVNETAFTPGRVPSGTSTRAIKLTSTPAATGPIATIGAISPASRTPLLLASS